MADKKISELPLINTISGSIVYVPIVHDGITEKITVENFSKFTNKYAAQTGSANIFTANQTINANLTVSGTSTVTGNASVGGNLVVNGKLTAQEIFTEITSASVIFESGSTIFGNTADDTHQFTGIVSINGITIGAQALNEFTASQLAVNLRIASTTGSINTTTSSFNSEFIKIGLTTSSIHFTTQSLNTQTGSQQNLNAQIGISTASLNFTSGALNAFSGSIIGQVSTISTFTASVNFTTQSLNRQTGSQDLINLRIASTTGSINTTTSSFDSVFLRISSTTGSINTTTSSFNSEFVKIGSTTSSIHFTTQSLNTQTGSQGNLNAQIGIATASLNFATGALNSFTGSVIGQTNTISTFTASVNFTTQSLNTQTGSQGLVNYQNSIITSSYRIELNSIEAYTASLKSAIVVSGTNVRIIGELSASRIYTEYITSSVLFVTGSNIIGDQSSDKHEFTGSVNIKDTLFVNGQAIGLSELNSFTGSTNTHILKQATQTGSQDLVNYNISVVTSSIDKHILNIATQTGSQQNLNAQIGIATASLNTYTGSNDSVVARILQTTASLNLTTGSLIGITNGLMALTASMKVASIVSSSQQIQNYFTFARTGSANTFYGTQTISGSVLVSGSLIPSVGIGQYTSSFGLGSNTNSWKDIWVASTGNINFLNNSGVVEGTLSSTANGLSALSLLLGTSSYYGSPTTKMYIGQGKGNNPNNTAIGVNVLQAATINENTGYGMFNTGIGSGVMTSLTVGMQNTVIGNGAMYQNGQTPGVGDGNVCVGYKAGAGIYDSGANVFVGSQAGENLYNSTGNIGIGFYALNAYGGNILTNNQFGYNIAIGMYAGRFLSGSSNNNIIIGYSAGPQSKAEVYNQLHIGHYGAPLLTGSLNSGNLSLTIKGALTVDADSPTTIHKITGSVIITGSNTLIGTKTISGSLLVSGTIAVGTDDSGYGRISFDAATNKLRIRSSKNGTDCTPISFWSQQTGGTFTESMVISGSNIGVGTSNTLGRLDVYRAAGLSGTAAIVISNGEAGNGRNWSLNTEVINAGDFAICQSTTNGGTPAPTAANTKLYISSGGFLKASNTGTFYDSTANYHEIKSNASDNTMIMWNSAASSPNGLFINYTASPNNTASQFLRCFDGNAGTERVSIRSNGGLANYQANDINLSDERTKKDIIPLESYWDKFKAIEIVKFKYKDQTHDDFNIGVIAQQIESVAPEFVDVDGFGKTPEDGVPLKSIYTADLHHATIKVLQEAMAKIEELKARIEFLENK